MDKLVTASAGLKNFSFFDHPALWIHNNAATDNYAYGVFGLFKHPVVNVLHEIAHCIEFGAQNYSSRMSDKGQLMFKSATTYVNGDLYPNPKTDQSIKREIRTFGIQAVLMDRAYGLLHSDDMLDEFLSYCQMRAKEYADWSLFTPNQSFCEDIKRVVDQWTIDKAQNDFTDWLDCVENSKAYKANKGLIQRYRPMDIVTSLLEQQNSCIMA